MRGWVEGWLGKGLAEGWLGGAGWLEGWLSGHGLGGCWPVVEQAVVCVMEPGPGLNEAAADASQLPAEPTMQPIEPRPAASRCPAVPPAVHSTSGQAVYVGINPYPHSITASLPPAPVRCAALPASQLASPCVPLCLSSPLPSLGQALRHPHPACPALLATPPALFPYYPTLQPGRVWERVVDTSLQPPEDALLEGGTPIRCGRSYTWLWRHDRSACVKVTLRPL